MASQNDTNFLGDKDWKSFNIRTFSVTSGRSVGEIVNVAMEIQEKARREVVITNTENMDVSFHSRLERATDITVLKRLLGDIRQQQAALQQQQAALQQQQAALQQQQGALLQQQGALLQQQGKVIDKMCSHIPTGDLIEE
ncbi:hypothetical protein TCAL_11247, partial [Tigriopus californicus]|eukprot:TCALIF_11247-PA protein Name:"Protein of unknown function" AED:0.20 eAED:0.20 QI:113/1/0.5/1/1/0.5/2/0/139